MENKQDERLQTNDGEREILLPVAVECALVKILKHYWWREQSAHAKLPKDAQLAHVFKDLQVVDDWLFKPVARFLPKGP
jgi:hypothetical protein